MIFVHSANQRDLNAIFEIDLRTYDYPLSYIEIKELLTSKEHFCVIASDDAHCVVGFAIFKKHMADGYLEIERIGVKAKSRHLGIGTRLLQAGDDYSFSNKLHEMFIIVPETKCLPGDPDDVSRWLRASGFKAVLPLYKEQFKMYGRTVDGIKFTRCVDAA